MSTKTLHVLFARMNPPTVAHATLLNAILEESEGHCRVYLSETHNVDNPLTFDERRTIIADCIPHMDRDECKLDGARDLFTAMDKVDGYMQENGYSHIVLWCGSDRIPAVKRVLLYPDRWKFKVMGIKHLDRSGSDVSATAVRAAVVNKDTTTYNRMAMVLPYSHDWLFDTLYERLTDGSLQSKTKTSKRSSNRI